MNPPGASIRTMAISWSQTSIQSKQEGSVPLSAQQMVPNLLPQGLALTDLPVISDTLISSPEWDRLQVSERDLVMASQIEQADKSQSISSQNSMQMYEVFSSNFTFRPLFTTAL